MKYIAAPYINYDNYMDVTTVAIWQFQSWQISCIPLLYKVAPVTVAVRHPMYITI